MNQNTAEVRRSVALGAHLRQYMLLFALLALCAFFSFTSPYFMRVDNLLNVALQSATNIVLAVGMTFVIASGGIDLSVGSIVALSGVVMGLSARAGLPPLAMIALGLAVGTTLGAFNGVLVSKARIPPFIATLATMSMARGIALIVTGTRPIYGMPAAFRQIGAGRWFGIPSPAIIALIVALVGAFILHRTKTGRYTLAIGGNERAAVLSGIDVALHKTVVYALMGLVAAVGALIVTARLNTAEPLAGSTFELDAIAATVMGGTSLAGGTAKISGTVVAALLLGVLRNGLTLLNVQSAYQQVAIGLVIVVAVLADRLREQGTE